MKQRCRETLERAYLFLDEELLSAEERLQIRLHLEDCRPCYERYGVEEEMTRLLARLGQHQRCPQSLRERIERLLHL
jgi:mycothiol system anti-sigma-R factor